MPNSGGEALAPRTPLSYTSLVSVKSSEPKQFDVLSTYNVHVEPTKIVGHLLAEK